MGHDQLFKSLLRELFREFLALFLPKVAAQLDFTTVEFLDRQLFASLPDGTVRKPDIVARIRTHEGEPELVVIHVEIQLAYRETFRKRIFDYYALLRLHHEVPVVPIALFLRGGAGTAVGEYRESSLGNVWLVFRFASIRLAQMLAEEYVDKGPLGAALAALMDRSRAVDPLELRASMLRPIAKSGYEDAVKFLLWNVVETYFELGEREREDFEKMAVEKGYDEIEELELTWADKMIEKGRQEGRETGIVQGKRDALIRLLTAKFGLLSDELEARIASVRSSEKLDACLERVLELDSIEELEIEL